jgi:hypothetical protein
VDLKNCIVFKIVIVMPSRICIVEASHWAVVPMECTESGWLESSLYGYLVGHRIARQAVGWWTQLAVEVVSLDNPQVGGLILGFLLP